MTILRNNNLNGLPQDVSLEMKMILCAAQSAADNASAKNKSIARPLSGKENFDNEGRGNKTGGEGLRQLDEERLMEYAAYHGMRPLLHRFLKSTGSNFFSGELVQSLAEFAKLNVQRNLRATGHLTEIIRALECHGISAIPYKGPALASLIYQDVGMREFSDLDLLVDRMEVFKAKEVMTELGYLPEIELAVWQEKIFLETGNVLLFTHRETKNLVELHWQLSPGYLAPATDTGALRKRLVEVYPGGQRMKTLSPEDYLVYLCVHGAKHLWERLGWLADIATLISDQPELDWDFVVEEAGRQKSERMLLLGLQLAREIIDIHLPLQIAEKIAGDFKVKSLAHESKKWLLTSTGSSPTFRERVGYCLNLHRRLREKMRYLVLGATAPNTMDWAFVELPQSVSFLYRIARPLRLLKGLFRA
jgi:hypothetical protein